MMIETSKHNFVPFVVMNIVIVSMYFPVLWFGYYIDDFFFLTWSFQDFFANPFRDHGRPLWSLTNLFANLVTTDAYWHHAINFVLMIAVANMSLIYASKRGVAGYALLLLCVGLTNPALVWPTAWISQRNDLLLMLFLLLALVVHNRWASFVLLQASLLSKSPYVLQALYFCGGYLYRKEFFKLVVTLSLAVTVVYFVFHTYYVANTHATEAHGLYIVKDKVPFVVSMAIRGLKVVEGLFYNLIPLPAVAINPYAALGFGTLMLVAWALIVPDLVAGLREMRLGKALRFGNWRNIPALPLFEPIIIALLLAACYAFGSHLRIYCPTLPFVFTALALACRPTRRSVAGMAILLVINMVGITLSLPNMDTGCYDLAAGPLPCTPGVVPAETWNETRMGIVDMFTQFLKAKL